MAHVNPHKEANPILTCQTIVPKLSEDVIGVLQLFVPVEAKGPADVEAAVHAIEVGLKIISAGRSIVTKIPQVSPQLN